MADTDRMTPSGAQLAEFFARCEDVLADWNGGTDAMHARPDSDDGKLPARADSYYDQITYAVPSRMVAFGVAVMLVPPMVLAGLVVGTVRAIRGRRA